MRLPRFAVIPAKLRTGEAHLVARGRFGWDGRVRWCGSCGCIGVRRRCAGLALGRGCGRVWASWRFCRCSGSVVVWWVWAARWWVCTNLGTAGRCRGVVTWVRPAGEVKIRVPSGNCCSRQPQKVLTKWWYRTCEVHYTLCGLRCTSEFRPIRPGNSSASRASARTA